MARRVQDVHLAGEVKATLERSPPQESVPASPVAAAAEVGSSNSERSSEFEDSSADGGQSEQQLDDYLEFIVHSSSDSDDNDLAISISSGNDDSDLD